MEQPRTDKSRYVKGRDAQRVSIAAGAPRRERSRRGSQRLQRRSRFAAGLGVIDQQVLPTGARHAKPVVVKVQVAD